MKSKTFLHSFRLLCGSALFAAPLADATSLYWDIDAATAGAGGSAPAGSWATSGTTWSTSATGTLATSAYTTLITDDLLFSAGTNAWGTYTVGLTSTQNANSLTFQEGNAIISGTGGVITLGGTGNVRVDGGQTATIGNNTSAIIDGTAGFTKLGRGTLTFNGTTQHTFTGGITVNGGTLNVDYANRGNNNQYILATNSLTLGGGGTFIVKGNGVNNSTQTVAGVTINAGGGVISNNPNGGTATINLGAITATAAGGSLQFTRGTGVGTITTTNTNDGSSGGGILSARIVNGVAGATTPDWAINNGSGTVASYTGYTAMPLSGGSSTTNYSTSAGGTLGGSLAVNTLKITGSATALALGGNTLTIASGGLLSVGGTAQTISGTAGATRLTAGNGSGTYDLIVHQHNTAGGGLTISAVIGDNAGNAVNLVKAGAGYLNLSGINTYSGNTYVNAGILDFGGNTPAGTGANIFVAPGVGVRFTAPSTTLLNRIAPTTEEFGIHTGSNSSAAIDFTNHPNAFLAGGYSGNSAKTDNFTGAITPGNNTYRIGFTGANGSFGMSSVLGGSTNGLIVGGNNVVLTNANTFGGETVIRTGAQLLLANTLALQNSALNVGTGSDTITGSFGLSRLHTNLVNDKLVTSATLGGLIGSRNLVLAYGGAYGNNAGQLNIIAIRGFTLNPASGASNSYTGVIANFARDTTITKTGDGTQLLGGADTYSGETTISNGTLQIGNASALGKGGSAGSSSGATTVASGATLDLNGTTNVVEPIILNGTGIGGNGALVNNSGSAASITGGIASLQITNGGAYSSAPTVSLSGTGTGAIAAVQFGLSNASITSITGSTNWVVGDIFTTAGGGGSGAVYEVTGVSAGAITGFNIVNAGSGYTTAPTGITKLSRTATTSAGTYTFNATNFAVAGLTLMNAGSGYDDTTTASFSAGGATATVQHSSVVLASDSSIGGSGNLTIGAVVSQTGGSRSLNKVGAGTLTLSAANTYTGTTTVNGGTLLINGNSSAAIGNVNVTTGTLGGTGTIGGAVAVAALANLAPGASIESLAAPSLTMAATSSFTWEAADNTPTGADLLALGGTVSLTNVTLSLDAATLAALGGGGWALTNKLTLISYLDPGTGITSGFNGYLDDTTYVFGANAWLFDYNDTTPGGNYGTDAIAASQNRFITMTVVPIPEPGAALLGGLGLLALLRRRRN